MAAIAPNSESIEAAEEEGNLIGLIDIIIQTISDEELCEEALSSLYRILVAKSSFELDVEQSYDKIVTAIASSLKTFIDEPSLLEVIFGCIRSFASKDKQIQELFCTEENIAMIVNGMNQHTENEETIQEQGCLVIESLAKDNQLEGLVMKNIPGVVDVVQQAATLITNERNKKYPTLALTAMGVE